MESVEGVKIDLRQRELIEWLQSSVGWGEMTLHKMPGDASFRRYFRVKSFVAMDAPPSHESCAPFVAIARALRSLGLQAPEIFYANIKQGFLLLSDLGDQTYLKALSPTNVDSLYPRALQVLSIMQVLRTIPSYSLPFFDADFMRKEWGWHKEWFVQKHLGIPTNIELLDQCYEFLINAATEQPQVFMHRDFHSANLMVLMPNDVGILDFQDAFIGPLTYDPVSLLRDCYIDWPAEKVKEWALYYFDLLKQGGELQDISAEQFMRWFDLMGIQRHIKALMTFARKKIRDQQVRYVEFIPRTLNYIITVSKQYDELAPLHDFYLKALSCAE